MSKQTTMLALVWAMSDVDKPAKETEDQAKDLLVSGQVVLTGNFKGYTWEEDNGSE